MRSLFYGLHRRWGTKISGTDRQDFVQKKMNSEARNLSPTDAEARRHVPRGAPRPRVAIVGAGFSGLMAAYSLAKCCDVTVFEARDRIGGRVWSKTRSSGVVEAGGELIGYNHPMWLRLAKQFGLGLSVITSDANFEALNLDMPLYLDGRKMSDPQMKTIYDEMYDAFDKMARQAERIDARKPWLAANAHKLDRTRLSDWIASQHCSRLTKLAMEQQFSNDGGQPADKQSYLAMLAVVRGGGLHKHPNAFFTQTETLRCSEGNQTLAHCLADSIRNDNGVIHLSAPVRAIDIDDGGVTVELEGKAPEAADYVILAIPPSLWPGGKFGKITITPQLPRESYVSMGTAVKYLSLLRERFWIKAGLAPTATSSRFGVTWEGTDNQIAVPGTDVELSLFAGSTVARSALNKWSRGGKSAVDAFYAARIGKIYKDYAENLSQPPEFMAWPADPWTGAGYSCPAPGEVCSAGPLLNTAFHKRMFFAGEHTCFAYFGYMEGALQSGHRAALAVLAARRRSAGRKTRGKNQAPAQSKPGK
jgi:monoamine oxidase